MKPCCDLYFLSTIACELFQSLPEEALAVLAINLTTLGDMVQVLITKETVCKQEQ